MKTTTLITVSLFAMSVAMNAQEVSKHPTTKTTAKTSGHEKMTPEQRAKKQVDGLGTEVTLSEDQKTKIYDLALAKAKKADEIKTKYKDQPENQETCQTELKAVRKEFRQNVKAALTAEQFEKLKAKHQEMKAAGKENSLDKD